MESLEGNEITMTENVGGNSEASLDRMEHDTMEQGPTEMLSFLQLKFSEEGRPPMMVLRTAEEEFGMMGSNNKKTPVYTKGIKFSPDGLCLLSNSNDNIIRLFEL